MKSSTVRERELYESGLVDSIKSLFTNKNINISEKYYILMADYISSLVELNVDEKILDIDPVELAITLPECVSQISEIPNLGIYGRTNNKKIEINGSLDYERQKLYFFHELTHALQTRKINGHEEIGFYNGDTGLFLTEGATQYIAEILYGVSSQKGIEFRNQSNTVRGHNEHIPYSPLSEYQLNGNILSLIALSIGMTPDKILELSYSKDGRKKLKEEFDKHSSIMYRFEDLMDDLEKIYDIDKLIIAGYGNSLRGEQVNISRDNGYTYKGNIISQGDLINQVQRELMSIFINNNSVIYDKGKQKYFESLLTTQELKNNFHNAMILINRMNENTRSY